MYLIEVDVHALQLKVGRAIVPVLHQTVFSPAVMSL